MELTENERNDEMKETEEANTGFTSSSLSRRKYLSKLSADAKPFESRDKDDLDTVVKKRVDVFDATKIPFSVGAPPFVPRSCSQKGFCNTENSSTGTMPIVKSHHDQEWNESKEKTVRQSFSLDKKLFINKTEKNMAESRERESSPSTVLKVDDRLQSKSSLKLSIIKDKSDANDIVTKQHLCQVEGKKKYPLMPLPSTPERTCAVLNSRLQADANPFCFAREENQNSNSIDSVITRKKSIDELELKEGTVKGSSSSPEISGNTTICKQLNAVGGQKLTAMDEKTKTLHSDHKISNTFESWCKDRNTLSQRSSFPNKTMNIVTTRNRYTEQCRKASSPSYTNTSCSADDSEISIPDHSNKTALPSKRDNPLQIKNTIQQSFSQDEATNEESKRSPVLKSSNSWDKDTRTTNVDESQTVALLKLQAMADSLIPKDTMKHQAQHGICPGQCASSVNGNIDTPEVFVSSRNITDPSNAKKGPTQFISSKLTAQRGSFNSKTMHEKVVQQHLNGLRMHNNEKVVMHIINNKPNQIFEAKVGGDRKLLQTHRIEQSSTNLQTFVSSVVSEESKAKFTPSLKTNTTIQSSTINEFGYGNHVPKCSTPVHDSLKLNLLESRGNRMCSSQSIQYNKPMRPIYNVPRFLPPRPLISPSTNGGTLELSNLRTIADRIMPKENVKELVVSNRNSKSLEDHLTRLKMQNNKDDLGRCSIEAHSVNCAKTVESANRDIDVTINKSFSKLSILPATSPPIPPRRNILNQNDLKNNSIIAIGKEENQISLNEDIGSIYSENKANTWLQALEQHYINKTATSDNIDSKESHSSQPSIIGPSEILNTDTILQKQIKNPFIVDTNMTINPQTTSSRCTNPFLDEQEIVSETSPLNTLTAVDIPKDPLWFYVDPKGETQGPFMSIEMAEWFHIGYFNDYLKVRRNCDKRFASIEEFLKLTGSSSPFLDSGSVPPLEIEEEIPRRSTNPFLYDI